MVKYLIVTIVALFALAAFALDRACYECFNAPCSYDAQCPPGCNCHDGRCAP
jgi:hypothetical protein